MFRICQREWMLMEYKIIKKTVKKLNKIDFFACKGLWQNVFI
jgi:hypothetical protein